MQEGSGTSTPRKRRPRRRRRRLSPKERPANGLEGLEASLTSAVREAYGEMFGGASDGARPFGLELKVSIEPGEPWRLQADPSIEEQIRTALREMAARTEALRAGRVYCYRCESTLCPHSRPPRPTSVFGGYSSTGLPIWPEFSQILLERRHPRVDLLYDGTQSDLVAMYVEPEILKHKQLNVFGRQSKTYDILGQVVFGFLRMRIPGAEPGEPERVAFTLQAVESRRTDGSPRLELNVLAGLSDGSPALDALQGSYQTRVADVIHSARRRIGGLRPPSRGSATRRASPSVPETACPVTNTLQGLARKLEKVGRQTSRRTAHAEGHRIKNRPTSKAWEEALSASEDSLLWDRQEKTFVVLAPRNRVHVFSQEGRHVTSLVLNGESVRSRKRRERWLPLTEDQRERFGSAIGLPMRPQAKRSKAGLSESPAAVRRDPRSGQ